MTKARVLAPWRDSHFLASACWETLQPSFDPVRLRQRRDADGWLVSGEKNPTRRKTMAAATSIITSITIIISNTPPASPGICHYYPHHHHHHHRQANPHHCSSPSGFILLLLLLSGLTDLAGPHFLAVAPHNESHNHYCPKVSCPDALLYQMTFSCAGSLAISISPFPCSNCTLFIWPPSCPLMQRRGIIKMIYRRNSPPLPPSLALPPSSHPPAAPSGSMGFN